MYKLKQVPEDFTVKEIFSPKLCDNGEYVYFTLKKKNYNTLDAIKVVARCLHVEEKNFYDRDCRAVFYDGVSIA